MQQPLRDLKCLTVSRAPLIRGRLPQGVGVGGWINVPDEHFSYVMEHVHVVHAAIGSSGGGVGGRGGDFSYVTEHMHVAHAVV